MFPNLNYERITANSQLSTWRDLSCLFNYGSNWGGNEAIFSTHSIGLRLAGGAQLQMTTSKGTMKCKIASLPHKPWSGSEGMNIIRVSLRSRETVLSPVIWYTNILFIYKFVYMRRIMCAWRMNPTRQKQIKIWNFQTFFYPLFSFIRTCFFQPQWSSWVIYCEIFRKAILSYRLEWQIIIGTFPGAQMCWVPSMSLEVAAGCFFVNFPWETRSVQYLCSYWIHALLYM